MGKDDHSQGPEAHHPVPRCSSVRSGKMLNGVTRSRREIIGRLAMGPGCTVHYPIAWPCTVHYPITWPCLWSTEPHLPCGKLQQGQCWTPGPSP